MLGLGAEEAAEAVRLHEQGGCRSVPLQERWELAGDLLRKQCTMLVRISSS